MYDIYKILKRKGLKDLGLEMEIGISLYSFRINFLCVGDNSMEISCIIQKKDVNTMFIIRQKGASTT